MLLDQITSMGPEPPNSYGQQIVDKLTEGFKGVLGKMGQVYQLNGSMDAFIRHQGSVIGSFMDKDLNLSTTRNSLLTNIDVGISRQTTEMSKGFASVEKELGRIDSRLTDISKNISILNTTVENLSNLIAENNSLLGKLRTPSQAQNPPMTVGMNNDIEDLQTTATAILQEVRDIRNINTDIYSELRSFHADVNTYLSQIYNRMNSLGATQQIQSSSGTSDIINSIGSAARSGSQASASSSSAISGTLRSLGGKFLGFLAGFDILGKVNAFMKNAHDMSNKMAVYAGMNAKSESWKEMAKIFSQSTSRLNGQGHLGDLSQVISVQEYYDAMSKALDAGMSAMDDLAGATEDLALTAKILPDITLNLTEGYAKDLLVGYDTGAETIKGVSMVIKDYSDNMYVAASTLQKAVEKHASTVQGLTKDMTQYIKKMNEYIATAAVVNENGLENLGLQETIDYFANTAVSQWSQDKVQGLAALGINPAELEKLAMTDNKAAMQMLLEGFDKRFDTSKMMDDEGNIVDWEGFRQLKEYANMVGVDTQEILAASNGKIDNALKDLNDINYGSNITGASNDSEMAAAIDSYANDKLTEQTNLTIDEEISNIAGIAASSENILNDILGWLNNHGLIMGGGIGSMLIGAGMNWGMNRIGSRIMNSIFGSGSAGAAGAGAGAAGAGAGAAGAGRIANFTNRMRSTRFGQTKFGSRMADIIDSSSAKVSSAVTKFKNTKFGSKLSSIVDDAGKAVSKGIAKFKSTSLGSKMSTLWDDAGKALSKGITKFKSTSLGSKMSTLWDDAGNALSKGLTKFKSTGLGQKVTSLFGQTSDDMARAAAGFSDDAAKAIAGSADDVAKAGVKAGAKAATKVAAVAGVVLDAGLGVEKTEEWFGDDKAGHKVASAIGGALGGSGSGIFGDQSVGEKALDIGSGALKGAAIGSIIPGVGTAIGAVVGAVGSAIGGENIAKFVGGITDFADEAHETVNKGIETAFDAVGLGNVGSAITGFRDGMWNAAGDVLGGALDGVGAAASGVVDGIGEAVGGIGSGIGKIAHGDILGGLADAGGGLIQGVGTVVGGVVDGVGKIGKGIWDGVCNVGKGIGDFFGNLFGGGKKEEEKAAKEAGEAMAATVLPESTNVTAGTQESANTITGVVKAPLTYEAVQRVPNGTSANGLNRYTTSEDPMAGDVSYAALTSAKNSYASSDMKAIVDTSEAQSGGAVDDIVDSLSKNIPTSSTIEEPIAEDPIITAIKDVKVSVDKIFTFMSTGEVLPEETLQPVQTMQVAQAVAPQVTITQETGLPEDQTTEEKSKGFFEFIKDVGEKALAISPLGMIGSVVKGENPFTKITSLAESSAELGKAAARRLKDHPATEFVKNNSITKMVGGAFDNIKSFFGFDSKEEPETIEETTSKEPLTIDEYLSQISKDVQGIYGSLVSEEKEKNPTSLKLETFARDTKTENLAPQKINSFTQDESTLVPPKVDLLVSEEREENSTSVKTAPFIQEEKEDTSLLSKIDSLVPEEKEDTSLLSKIDSLVPEKKEDTSLLSKVGTFIQDAVFAPARFITGGLSKVFGEKEEPEEKDTSMFAKIGSFAQDITFAPVRSLAENLSSVFGEGEDSEKPNESLFQKMGGILTAPVKFFSGGLNKLLNPEEKQEETISPAVSKISESPFEKMIRESPIINLIKGTSFEKMIKASPISNLMGESFFDDLFKDSPMGDMWKASPFNSVWSELGLSPEEVATASTSDSSPISEVESSSSIEGATTEEPVNPVVEAIMTLQENIVARLDRMITNEVYTGNVKKAIPLTPVTSGTELGDMDIRRYTR